MDNVAPFDEQRLFFATGKRHGAGVQSIEGSQLRPALLARYRDLTKLRYDFPLVLIDEGPQAGSIRSLSSIVDEMQKRVVELDAGRIMRDEAHGSYRRHLGDDDELAPRALEEEIA
jgi:hypothetical protein